MIDTAKMKALREKAGLTMEQAAQRAGFTNAQGKPQRQRWYDVESGRRVDVAAETLRGIATALECSMESLLLDDPDELKHEGFDCSITPMPKPR